MSDPQTAKAQIRATVTRELRRLTAEDRHACSTRACHRLASTDIWQHAVTILAYAPRADELDLGPLIDDALQSGRRVALPRFDPDSGRYQARQIVVPIADLAPGHYGIREPDHDSPSVSMNLLDLILVPGVAFDLTGRRLGRGRGYYDQLLANVRAVKCGLAFDQQVMAQIPVESHDVMLDCVLTPERWLDFRRLRRGDDLVG